MEYQHSRAAEAQVDKDDELPQCKIKRNYSCNHCAYFTQNPRFHLTHLRDIHGERIVINKCNLCLYASRHYQKLMRHMKMVHGSTEGIAGQSRKRGSPEESACSQEQKRVSTPPLPPLLYPIELTTFIPNRSGNLSHDLELSRNSLKDIAALYFAENHIDKIMSQMEEADAVQLPPMVEEDLSISIKRKPQVSSFFDEIKKSSVHEVDLNCPCGHVSKCFSETIIHRRSCNRMSDRHLDQTPSLNEASGSTRCQHCRRRCKSSADLVNHLKNCLQYEILQRSKCRTSGGDAEIDLESREIDDVSGKDDGTLNEQQIFSLKSEKENGGDREITPAPDEVSMNGIERCHQLPQTSKKPSEEDKAGGSSVKKVFKCPRCSFWASTASRFHVHIVGHLNKKPFRCSLCTYRSNWRWDITKHIRLKSIRNPCHKNARVLMSDDTGRRNYTKYNRFITMMRVNNEDGDPKLIKTGEMTPNQVASLSSQSDLAEDVSLTECKDKSDDKKQELVTDGKRRLPPPLVRFNDIIDIRTDVLTKKTFYKCRKCYFRHANRDAVLAHVRIHHQDPQLRLPPSTSKGDHSSSHQAAGNLYMNKVFAAAMNLTQKQLMPEHKSHVDTYNNQCSTRGEVTSSTGNFGQVDDALKKTAGSSEVPLKDNEKTPSVPSSTSASSGTLSARSSSIIGNVSKSAMLRVITSTSFGNDAPDKINLSPFRCGHCHQVSNWKHVIQRHCRLKHFGDIRIETLDRSSDGRTITYRALDFYGQQRHSQETTSDNHLLKELKVHQQTPSSADNSSSAMKGDNLQDSSVSSCNSDQDFLLNQLEISRLPHKSNSSIKPLKWPPLPHVSQAMHTSLYTSSEFKCTMCSYICAKRQHLTNHMKVHEYPRDSKRCNSDEATTAPAVDTVETTNCPKCPERFMNASKKPQQLQKSLETGPEFKCSTSDLSVIEDTIMTSHSLGHEKAYLDKSEKTTKDCKDDVEFSSQKLPTIKTPTSGAMKPTNSQSVDVEKANPSKSENSPKCLNAEMKNSMYCPYCPFKSDCSKTLQSHLQNHIRVSNCRSAHLCEHCDFNAPSKDDLDEHTRLHFDFINNKSSAAFYTSFDKLELIVTDNVKKKRKDDKLTTTKKIEFMNESKAAKEKEKTEQDRITNLRKRRCSGPALKAEKKPTPITTNQKTILVNPKTGQVIQRK